MTPAIDINSRRDPPRGSPTDPAAALTPRQLKQIAWLTGGALALYFLFRWLPTGTNLAHADFRVSEGAGSSLEFCDPSNPQFLPVVSVRSPVQTQLASEGPVVAGEPARFTLTLRTAKGKPIGPVDLLESHTRKLHVMAVDPTLTDYQHLHPTPGSNPGEWVFDLTPRASGLYRFFCDFTPAATARGLYASADFAVAGSPMATDAQASDRLPALNWTSEHEGYVFTLQNARSPIRAREPVDLALRIHRPDGGEVPLGEVMGAFAHLVAFDQERSGFAHLHPRETDLSRRPDAQHPRLTFQVTIPQSGRYVVWAQVYLNGRDVYVPFWLEVT
jgi:hypothetical protein